MTNERFDEMVKRLEIMATNEPAKYRLRVALLAVLGYAYIALVLTVLLGLCLLLVGIAISVGKANLIIIKVGWVLLVLAAVVIRSLWVKQTPPKGFELTRADAPRLFDLIEELTKSLGAPRIHHVQMLDFFNAAVVQVPRFGFFGGYKNYLLLGLPDLQACPPAQFRATLAHELGHLSGQHGRFASWIYRLRRTWGQLLQRLEADGRWGSLIFTSFLNWYAPYFQAYSFVLARKHEYEADEAAARLTGARNVAEMLIDTRLKESYLEENYWPQIYRRAETEAQPAADVYANLPLTLGEPVAQESLARGLQLALARKTDSADTHPALADRLRALGYPSQNGNGNGDWVERYKIAPVEQSAADFYLGSHAQTLVAQFDRAWQESIAEQWSERHNYVLRSQKTLSELEEKARSGGALAFDEAWLRASLAAEFKTPEEATPLLRHALDLRPAHAGVNFLLGQTLLRQADEAGIAHLERAASLEQDLLIPACQILFQHFNAQGQTEQAERYRERANQYYAKLEAAQPERATIRSPKELISHQADPAEVKRLCEQLSQLPRVKKAYLAQKRLKLFPEKPLYVLGVVPKVPWYQLNHDKANRKLVDQLAAQLSFSGETLILALAGDNKKFLKGFRKLEGSQIFS